MLLIHKLLYNTSNIAESLIIDCIYCRENWFGILYSWADSKKKSSLMLSLFEPGNV